VIGSVLRWMAGEPANAFVVIVALVVLAALMIEWGIGQAQRWLRCGCKRGRRA
jgi:hypothetical protein